MREHLQFYIDGRWVDPASPRSIEVSESRSDMERPSNGQTLRRYGRRRPF